MQMGAQVRQRARPILRDRLDDWRAVESGGIHADLAHYPVNAGTCPTRSIHRSRRAEWHAGTRDCRTALWPIPLALVRGVHLGEVRPDGVAHGEQAPASPVPVK